MNECADGPLSMGVGAMVVPPPPAYFSTQAAVSNGHSHGLQPLNYWCPQLQSQSTQVNGPLVPFEMPSTSLSSRSLNAFSTQAFTNADTEGSGGIETLPPALFQQQLLFKQQHFQQQSGGNCGTGNTPFATNNCQQFGQQISSPSVSSTADLANGAGGGLPQLVGQINQPSQFGMPSCSFSSQMQESSFPNGFCGPPSTCDGRVAATKNTGYSPMMIGKQPGQSFSSPMTGQQLQTPPKQMQQMMITMQPRWNGPIPPQVLQNGQMPAGMIPPHIMMNVPQQQITRFPLNPPIMDSHMTSPLIQQKRSFLFNTEMANQAAQNLRTMDMTIWHFQALGQLYMQNPCTSKALFDSQVSLSSLSLTVSRGTKRKAFAHTILSQQEQPHSMSSPSPHGPPLSTGTSLPQVHLSTDLCDSSTNSDLGLFKRPPSRMPSLPTANGLMSTNYMSPNSAHRGNNNNNSVTSNCFARIDDENPLKKMEIMTSKTLNEPSTKMTRFNDELLQQRSSSDTGEKIRKLEEIEKCLLFAPSQNGITAPTHISMDDNAQFRHQFFLGQMPPHYFGQQTPMIGQLGDSSSAFDTEGYQMQFGVVPRVSPTGAQQLPVVRAPDPLIHTGQMVCGDTNSLGVYQQPSTFGSNGDSGGPTTGDVSNDQMNWIQQSMDGMDSEIPSLKFQHLPNGQLQNTTNGTKAMLSK